MNNDPELKETIIEQRDKQFSLLVSGHNQLDDYLQNQTFITKQMIPIVVKLAKAYQYLVQNQLNRSIEMLKSLSGFNYLSETIKNIPESKMTNMVKNVFGALYRGGQWLWTNAGSPLFNQAKVVASYLMSKGVGMGIDIVLYIVNHPIFMRAVLVIISELVRQFCTDFGYTVGYINDDERGMLLEGKPSASILQTIDNFLLYKGVVMFEFVWKRISFFAESVVDVIMSIASQTQSMFRFLIDSLFSVFSPTNIASSLESIPVAGPLIGGAINTASNMYENYVQNNWFAQNGAPGVFDRVKDYVKDTTTDIKNDQVDQFARDLEKQNEESISRRKQEQQALYSGRYMDRFIFIAKKALGDASVDLAKSCIYTEALRECFYRLVDILDFRKCSPWYPTTNWYKDMIHDKASRDFDIDESMDTNMKLLNDKRFSQM
jgi:hypothetical protein